MTPSRLAELIGLRCERDVNDRDQLKDGKSWQIWGGVGDSGKNKKPLSMKIDYIAMQSGTVTGLGR